MVKTSVSLMQNGYDYGIEIPDTWMDYFVCVDEVMLQSNADGTITIIPIGLDGVPVVSLV